MMKIDFHYDGKNVYQIGVYRRLARAFKRKGLECRFMPDRYPDPHGDAELFVVQAEYTGEKPERLNRPIIVEERQDSCMPISRDVIALSNVIRFFKVGVVREQLINVRAERVHLWLLDPATAESTCPTRRTLNSDEIKKVQPGIHFGLFHYLDRWVDRARERNGADHWHKRPIDALFIGTTRYGLPTLDKHRQRFCEALRSIHGLNIV